MTVERQKRLIALAIGIGTVAVGLFSWRAGQIGSTANFDDRQAIGQQVDAENVRIDVAVEASRQAGQYNRYVAEYGVAADLDDEAETLRAAGDDTLAAAAELEAESRREAATSRAFAAGVFGDATLANPQVVTPEPRPFDLERRILVLENEATTGLGSKGGLDPDAWATEADEIRARVRTMTQWVALLLTVVVLLTAAEVTVSRRVRAISVALGGLLFAVGLVGGLTNGYFS